MPPKPKFTKEEIVQTALQVVSQKGVEALTAKELGDALGSSSRPMDIYFDNAASIALGIMFILGSLLCRYGAELKERAEK